VRIIALPPHTFAAATLAWTAMAEAELQSTPWRCCSQKDNDGGIARQPTVDRASEADVRIGTEAV
jgi:hypothetical protein